MSPSTANLAADQARSAGVSRLCSICDYDLRDAPALRCPECGAKRRDISEALASIALALIVLLPFLFLASAATL